MPLLSTFPAVERNLTMLKVNWVTFTTINTVRVILKIPRIKSLIGFPTNVFICKVKLYSKRRKLRVFIKNKLKNKSS